MSEIILEIEIVLERTKQIRRENKVKLKKQIQIFFLLSNQIKLTYSPLKEKKSLKFITKFIVINSNSLLYQPICQVKQRFANHTNQQLHYHIIILKTIN